MYQRKVHLGNLKVHVYFCLVHVGNGKVQIEKQKENEPPKDDSFYKLTRVIELIILALGVLVALIK